MIKIQKLAQFAAWVLAVAYTGMAWIDWTVTGGGIQFWCHAACALGWAVTAWSGRHLLD